jgi:acid phosphatase (class A)
MTGAILLRKTIAACLLAALAGCAGAPKKTAEPPRYLPEAAVEALRFVPPPAPGSPVDAADIETLRGWQARRTKADCDGALAQTKARYETLIGEAGPFALPLKPAPAAFFERLYRELFRETLAVKKRYGRPRPYARGLGLETCIGGVQDDSYPSGHAVNARFYANAISVLRPERHAAYMAAADKAALNRVIGGVHHPSDIEAGKRLADELFSLYMREPAFRADLERLRKYLKEEK